MSKKFTLVADHATEDAVITLEHSKIKSGTYYKALLFDGSGEDYTKEVAEAAVNLFVEITQSLTNNKDFKTTELNSQGINLKFVGMLKSLGMFIGYFVNSTSWNDQKLHDFDIQELINRLERVKQQIR